MARQDKDGLHRKSRQELMNMLPLSKHELMEVLRERQVPPTDGGRKGAGKGGGNVADGDRRGNRSEQERLAAMKKQEQ